MELRGSEHDKRGAILRTLIRLAIIAAFVFATLALLNWAQMLASSNPNLMLGLTLLLFATYVLLMAVPFVPGIEIGLALMIFKGPEIVIWVYLATVLGLMISFMIGHLTKLSYLHKVFADIGWKRPCLLIEALQKYPRDERLNLFRSYMPKFLRPLLIEGRYLAIAVALNIPGNTLLGGGGGILLVAGLSRVFRPLWMLITLIVAVAPIPFSILVLGIDPISYFFD